jgi:predicted GH43/DUF377 family glycosyl hydrolase
MKWRKMGHVYRPSGQQWWSQGYTHLPTADLLDDDVLRIYFAALDGNNYGRIAYVDLDARDPRRVLDVSPAPVLDLGELGTFDDCGAVPSCVIDLGGRKALYYIGFQRAQRVPYMLFTGLALFDAARGCWQRRARTPLLDRTESEPFSRSAPCVLREPHGFRMWYWSCLRWTAAAGGVHYNNVIRHARSQDGIAWAVDEHICLAPDLPDEYSLGRPSVVRDRDGYKMWFSARSHSRGYTVGYAESPDGLHWQRQPGEVIPRSTDGGWDSEMICYPYVIDVRGRRLLFYNGNRHGASGFGFAVLEE